MFFSNTIPTQFKQVREVKWLELYRVSKESVLRLFALSLASLFLFILSGCFEAPESHPGDAHGFTGISVKVGIVGGKSIIVADNSVIDLGLKLSESHPQEELYITNLTAGELTLKNISIKGSDGEFLEVQGIAGGQKLQTEVDNKFIVKVSHSSSKDEKSKISLVVANDENEEIGVTCEAVSMSMQNPLQCNYRGQPPTVIYTGHSYQGVFPQPEIADGVGALTYSVKEQPTNGTILVTNASLGAFTYTPNVDAPENYSFSGQYKISAESGDTCESGISLYTISPFFNNFLDPNYQVTALSSSQPTLTTLYLPNVEGQVEIFGSVPPPVRSGFRIVASPAHGKLSRFTGNQVNFIANANYIGADEFSYEIYDLDFPDSTTNTVTVSVSIQPGVSFSLLSVPMVTQADRYSDPRMSTQIQLHATNGFHDASVIMFSILKYPSHGTLSLGQWQYGTGVPTGNNWEQTYTVTYTPDDRYSGPDQFAYNVYNISPSGSSSVSNAGIVNLIPAVSPIRK